MKTALLILSFIANTAHCELVLKADFQKQVILTGEAAVVKLTLLNNGKVPIRGIFLLPETLFEIVPPAPKVGMTTNLILGKLMPEGDYREKLISPGTSISTTVTLVYDSAKANYIFLLPGEYKIRAQKELGYKINDEEKQQVLQSDSVALSVREPDGIDKRVWEEMRDKDVARLFRHPDDVERSQVIATLRSLLQKYSKSSYAPQISDLLKHTQ